MRRVVRVVMLSPFTEFGCFKPVANLEHCEVGELSQRLRHRLWLCHAPSVLSLLDLSFSQCSLTC